ncbi:amidotransferase [Azorhizobium oxalatiphilum]|uniref:Amidotransferase n=1 Tax=Azorhizobium oxalatiphilum TaxID=980631 RepID=A0A917C5M6_9HYPH|nr:amidase [Azorhizobium oxalatiphilum]GGF70157.1 amidotransferase [Azorhizobium oxalatiphilum]
MVASRNGIATGTAVDIAADVQAGRASAAEVAASAIARIEAAADLVAIVDFNPEEGRAAARAVDARLAAGERLPLAGVPLAIKDNIWVGGRRVTQGSLLTADFIAPADAITVERLKRAGAVIMGMANTSEFACKGLTTNKVYGTTRHPMDPTLTPGGSSGGPSSAVAGGLVPLALGTDAGGSSRRPPAHVGAVGFKPSYGAIPRGPGFPSPFAGISCPAPIAMTVADVALMFSVLRGPDARDPDSLLLALPDDRPPEALRLAFSPTFGLDAPVDAEVTEGLERAMAALTRHDLAVTRRDPPWPEGASETALMPAQHAGLAAIHGEAFRRDPDLFDPDIAAQIERGLALDGATVARTLILGQEITRALGRFFMETDILMGPTVPCVAWPNDRLGPERIGGQDVAPRAHAVFTPLFNHARVPAISIPVGRGRDGLPFGLQIIATRGHDDRLLSFAARVEAILATEGLWP